MFISKNFSFLSAYLELMYHQYPRLDRPAFLTFPLKQAFKQLVDHTEMHLSIDGTDSSLIHFIYLERLVTRDSISSYVASTILAASFIIVHKI